MRPQLNAGERTYGIKGTEHSYTASRFPLHGESDNWVPVALPDDGSTVTLTGCKVSNTYYVDAEHGNDAWDGTTDYAHRDENLGKGPKRSLQAAHDCAEEGSDSAGYPIVLASPGVYDEGVTNIYSSGTSDLCKRRLHVSKRISFIATEGADRTFVVGAPDPENGACGTNAVGGIYASGSGFKFLQGFTITGCYSPSTQSKANQYGAAFCSENVEAYLLDCVISNNFAVKYSAANSGSFFRTRIYDNESTNYVARNCYFASCMFAGNRITASNNAVFRVCSRGTQPCRHIRIYGTYGTMELEPIEDFRGVKHTTGLNEGLYTLDTLEIRMFLKKVNGKARKLGYKEGVNRLVFKAPKDRYAGQLKELARILRGEIPNPPGLYLHDLKVHKVSLDACNLETKVVW